MAIHTVRKDSEFSDNYIPVPITEGIILERKDGTIWTNVPHLAVHHSPTGFEWGYGGSGPADLALNIVELSLSRLGYQGERVKCSNGDCWDKALELHQQFKWEFIAPANRMGTVIPYDVVRNWLKAHLDQEGTR